MNAVAARALLAARRKREALFPPGIFADPAFDMLLDLYAARIEGRAVSVSSLCIASAVPSTTALRWIDRLADLGLLERRPDLNDGRRRFVEISESAAQAMADCLGSLREPRPQVAAASCPACAANLVLGLAA